MAHIDKVKRHPANKAEQCIMPSVAAGGYRLTKEQLLRDLYRAYRDARKHKRGKPYQLKFELHLEDNLLALRDALWDRTYKPLPSKCFIIHDPTMREVFAADFGDRIVHHLYYNYTCRLYDRTFIEDAYSCRKGKGTLYGMQRLERHIREASCDYARSCYVLKMDISGYFMHIDRRRLLDLCLATLRKMAWRGSGEPGKRWRDKTDMGFVEWLTREIVLLNPIEGCRTYGSRDEWRRLPRSKSLYHSPEGCGLPIGNLTSQVFSNVYLNVLDQWMKRETGCRHYGRYVDDFYVVSHDRRWLASLTDKVEDFLATALGLTVNRNKTQIYDVRHGVPFLGYFLKPSRTYLDNRTWRRMKRHTLDEQHHAGDLRFRSCVNSYLGYLRHTRSYRMTDKFFAALPRVRQLGYIVPGERKLVFSQRTQDTLLLRRLLHMAASEHYLVDFADIELWYHWYVDRYVEER